MKKFMKRVLMTLVIGFALIGLTFTTVLAFGGWEGTPIVNESHSLIEDIKILFQVKNDKISELESGSKDYETIIVEKDKIIREQGLVIHEIREKIVLKDQEILIQVQENQALKNVIAGLENDILNLEVELAEANAKLNSALSDVEGIRDELFNIVETEGNN